MKSFWCLVSLVAISMCAQISASAAEANPKYEFGGSFAQYEHFYSRSFLGISEKSLFPGSIAAFFGSYTYGDCNGKAQKNSCNADRAIDYGLNWTYRYDTNDLSSVRPNVSAEIGRMSYHDSIDRPNTGYNFYSFNFGLGFVGKSGESGFGMGVKSSLLPKSDNPFVLQGEVMKRHIVYPKIQMSLFL